MSKALSNEVVDELKPCPFCGKFAMIRFDDSNDYKRHWGYVVGCHYENNCNVEPKATDKDKGKAVELWNQRAS